MDQERTSLSEKGKSRSLATSIQVGRGQAHPARSAIIAVWVCVGIGPRYLIYVTHFCTKKPLLVAQRAGILHNSANTG